MNDSLDDLMWKIRYTKRIHNIAVRHAEWQRRKFIGLRWYRLRDNKFLLGCEKALDEAFRNRCTSLIDDYLSVTK